MKINLSNHILNVLLTWVKSFAIFSQNEALTDSEMLILPDTIWILQAEVWKKNSEFKAVLLCFKKLTTSQILFTAEELDEEVATIIKGDPKVSFSIATTTRGSGGRHTIS